MRHCPVGWDRFELTCGRDRERDFRMLLLRNRRLAMRLVEICAEVELRTYQTGNMRDAVAIAIHLASWEVATRVEVSILSVCIPPTWLKRQSHVRIYSSSERNMRST